MPANRCAWPMAMPSDTPMPCMVKQTEELIVRSLSFAELVGEELLDRVQRRGLVLAVGLELDGGPDPRGQHHHAHDALGVHAPALARDEELRLEARRELRELGRRARVQSQLVGDLDRAFLHQRRCSMRTMPSPAPASALPTSSSS